MKFFFKIISSVVVLSFAQQASADTTLVVTGSTAFRRVVHDTIVDVMGGTPSTNTATCKITTTIAAPGTISDSNCRSTINGANIVTFVGSWPGISGTTTIKCTWSGSATGLIALYNSTQQRVVDNTAATAGYSNAVFGATVNPAPVAPDFAFSDMLQSSVTSTSVTGLTEINVAVVPFTWIANTGTETLAPTFTNMTAQGARGLYGKGIAPLWVFTGDDSDTTTRVFATGRDGGSGTRAIALAETKYGMANPITQYSLTVSGTIGSGTVTSVRIWPTSGTAVFDPSISGNGGYGVSDVLREVLCYTSSGGVHAYRANGTTTLTDPYGLGALTSVNAVIVGYLGASDAALAVSYGAKRLLYEGSSFDGSAGDKKNIYTGKYTFWGYEHLSYNGSLSPGGAAETFRDAMVNNISYNLGDSGLDLSLMRVSRSGEGEVVGP